VNFTDAGGGGAASEAGGGASGPVGSSLSALRSRRGDSGADGGGGGARGGAASPPSLVSGPGGGAVPPSSPGAAAVARRRADEEDVSDEETAVDLPAPVDGPVFSGALLGVPHRDDARGRVEVYVTGGEFWVCLREPTFYNIPASDYANTRIYLSKRALPRNGKFNVKLSVNVPIPGTDGALPDPPSAAVRAAAGSGMRSETRWSLAEVLDDRRGRGSAQPVDPRRFKSVVFARPGVFTENGNCTLPTLVYAFAELVPHGSTSSEIASANAEAMRRASLGLGPTLGPSFASSELKTVDISTMSYEDLDKLAAGCFGQLGKPKVGGFLTFSEFNTVLAQLGLKFTEARAFVWFDCADEDGSGTMEYEEFRHLMAMVSRVAPPPFLTLRDVFALFAVDNAKEAAERAKAEEDFKQGVVGAVEPPPRPPVRLELPRVDMLAVKAILEAFRYEAGIVVKPEKVEGMFMFADSRTNMGSLSYQQMKSMFLQLVDPRAELFKRGVSVKALLSTGQVRDGSAESLSKHLEKLIDEEDEELLRDLAAGMAEAARMKEEWEAEREARLAEEAAARGPVDKKALRAKAAAERAHAATMAAEEKAAVARRALEDGLAAASIAAETEAAAESTRLDDEARAEMVAREAARRARLGLDNLDLSSRSLQFLPPLMWGTPEGRLRLNHLVVLDVSNNALVALPGANLFGNTPKLQKLVLDSNRLSALPEELGGLSDLLIFSAANNVLERVPPGLGGCAALRSLSLHTNRLTELPGGGALGGLRALEEMHLGTNWLRELPADYDVAVSVKAADTVKAAAAADAAVFAAARAAAVTGAPAAGAGAGAPQH